MKLIVAIIPQERLDILLDVFQQHGVSATVLHVEWTFLSSGSALLLIAVFAARVPGVRAMIADAMTGAQQEMMDAPPLAPGLLYLLPLGPCTRDAVTAVLPLARYERF